MKFILRCFSLICFALLAFVLSEQSATAQSRVYSSTTLPSTWVESYNATESFKRVIKVTIPKTQDYSLHVFVKNAKNNSLLNSSNKITVKLYDSKGQLVRNSHSIIFRENLTKEEIRHNLKKGDYKLVISSIKENAEFNYLINTGMSIAYDTPLKINSLFVQKKNLIVNNRVFFFIDFYAPEVGFIEVSVKRPQDRHFKVMQKDSTDHKFRYLPKTVGKHSIKYRIWDRKGRELTITKSINVMPWSLPKDLKISLHPRVKNGVNYWDITTKSNSVAPYSKIFYKHEKDKKFKEITKYAPVGTVTIKAPKRKGKYTIRVMFKQYSAYLNKRLDKTYTIK